MKQLVVISGGFHPFHAGHMALYTAAKEAFPDAQIVIGATNAQKDRPFPFKIKQKLAQVSGVPPKDFVEVSRQFSAEDPAIASRVKNPNDTILIFARSEKDKNEPPMPAKPDPVTGKLPLVTRGPNKGKPISNYLQYFAGNEDNLQPMTQHAYMAYLPTVEFGPGITSASEIRAAWPTLNDKRKTAMVMSLYPATKKNSKLANNVKELLDLGMTGDTVDDLSEGENWSKHNKISEYKEKVLDVPKTTNVYYKPRHGNKTYLIGKDVPGQHIDQFIDLVKRKYSDLRNADKDEIFWNVEPMREGWSEKYKRSIDCSHPKGFSQKAHCAGKKKHNESVELEMTCPDCGMCETHAGQIAEGWTTLSPKGKKNQHSENAIKTLMNDLRDPHGYQAIDHIMTTIANKYKITPHDLHLMFVDKVGTTPDVWIRKVGEKKDPWDNGLAEGSDQPVGYIDDEGKLVTIGHKPGFAKSVGHANGGWIDTGRAIPDSWKAVYTKNLEQGVAEGSLEELANTSLKVKEPKDMYNVNDRKQTTYKIFKFKSGKKTFLINFTVKSPPTYGKKQNWNAVIVSFGVKEKQDDYSFGDEMNTDLTGKNKNQFLIYSTVINTIRRFITEYNTEIDEIIMQGAGERQEAMYQRFFQSAPKYFPGWHYDGKHSLVRDVPRQKVKKVREQDVAEGDNLTEFDPNEYSERYTVYMNREKIESFPDLEQAVEYVSDILEDEPNAYMFVWEIIDIDGKKVWEMDSHDYVKKNKITIGGKDVGGMLGGLLGVAEGRENYNGVNILFQKDDDEIFVKASAGGRELGHVLFVVDGDYLMPQDLEVEERYRGQGIAQIMYDYVKSKGYKIRRSGQQTDAGAGFWDKHKGQGQNVWEQGVAEAFDKPHKTKLNELFTSYGGYELHHNPRNADRGYIYSFNTKDKRDGEIIIKPKHLKQGVDSIVFVEFNIDGSTDTSGKGDAIMIFSTVLKAVNGFAREYKPQYIVFETEDPEKLKLYRRLVKYFVGYKPVDWIKDTVLNRQIGPELSGFAEEAIVLQRQDNADSIKTQSPSQGLYVIYGRGKYAGQVWHRFDLDSTVTPVGRYTREDQAEKFADEWVEKNGKRLGNWNMNYPYDWYLAKDPSGLEFGPAPAGQYSQVSQQDIEYIAWYLSQQQNLDKQGVAEEQHSESCPHCGGELVSEELMNEKKDACYYKVKSRYKVWPSAYASGALVKCRKAGASNWGNGGKKNESSILGAIEQVDENLHQWFKEKWVRFGPDGKIRGDCARGDDSEGKPKCLPQSKAHSLGKKGRASAAARKRREDPNPERHGKAINVNTKKKSNESVVEDNKPAFMELDNMKPFKVSGKEIPGSVETLEKLLLKAKDRGVKLDYNNIDKMMQLVCREHHLTGDDLHVKFVKKHHMIPDNWIKKQTDVTESVDYLEEK